RANLLILTSCSGYLKRAYKNVIFTLCSVFTINHAESIAPIPTSNKTVDDVVIIINWTFPVRIEINV
ncbi:MAG: hypothetical protein ACT4N1_04395, partial [Nitrososphaerota archaeon]